MPIYEFCCQNCKAEFEKLVMKNEGVVSCPECGSSKVKKLFSAFGFKSGNTLKSSSSGSCASCTASSCASCKG